MRISPRSLFRAAALSLALVVAGCTSSSPQGAGRTVDITMVDNSFQPSQLQMSKGEVVTLRFRNTGAVKHEAIVGDDQAQMEHHDEMSGTAEMDHGDGHGPSAKGSSGAISVEPGQMGELTHTFGESSSILIGCHEPGHWEAGMKATVKIG